jgi:steroid 5-alpha reductase family enzyme
MEYNEIDKQRLLKINWGLRFGIFTVCSSLLFTWMAYSLPVVVPPLKIFLFPVVGCVIGAQLILESYKKYYISDKLFGLAFVLFGVTFISIFNNIPWYAIIIPILLSVGGLVILYQSFSRNKNR